MNREYARIEKAIRYIRSNVSTQPGLGEIASHVGLSPFHFQRLFSRWAGVSPKRFLEYLTVDHAKKLLGESLTVMDTSHTLGLTSPSRLHDHFISMEAITPGEFKARGAGIEIYYGIHSCPFGSMLLAQSQRGICTLSFILDDQSLEHEIDALHRQWPDARISEESARTAETAGRIFTAPYRQSGRIYLTVRGTNFQVNVWKALLKIPPGHISSYQEIAAQLGAPRAFRAVASAIAANPVGYLIPCHRVLRSNGDLGGYKWGTERKHALIAWEAARREPYNIDDDYIAEDRSL